jgi:hypothetical protein
MPIMRAVVVVSLIALLFPAVAMAQSAPAPSSAPSPTAVAPATAPATPGAASKKGGDITRDAYIERAKQNAEKRFDRMDADHDGVLTADERRAYRATNSKRRSPKPQ